MLEENVYPTMKPRITLNNTIENILKIYKIIIIEWKEIVIFKMINTYSTRNCDKTKSQGLTEGKETSRQQQ